MARAKQTSKLIGAATGAALAVTAAFSPAAAQEATPIAQPQDTVWTEELRAFDAAASAARDYAENNYGVGILVHVGEDFPNEHFATAQEFADLMVKLFEARHGTPAQAFLRPNPGTQNTGLTYHIGSHIHGANSGTEVKGVDAALAAMPDVVEQLRLVKELAALQPDQPSPSAGG